MRLIRATLTATAALLIAVPATAADTSVVPPAGYDVAGITRELDRQCKAGEFAGAVVVRVRGRNILEHACGEADAVNHVPNSLETRFKIYSTSKFITALTVLRLVEQKRIDLDAPITRYVPEAPDAWSGVTIRRLLNHTSGLKDLSEPMVAAYRTDFPSAIRSVIAGLTAEQRTLATPPGAQFAYNNFGFDLLALTVANVERQPFPAVVQRLVFDPAGMRTASFQPPSLILGHPIDAREPGLAIGYNGAPDKLEQATNWAFMQQGAGAIRATVHDFIALDAALAEGRLIAPATAAEMVRKVDARPESGRASDRRYGLGILVTEGLPVRMEGHTGGNNGFIADFERYPDDGAMLIALTNRGFAKTAWLRKAVAEMLAAARPEGVAGRTAPRKT